MLKTELKTKDDRLQESERHLLLSTKGKTIYVFYIHQSNVHVIMCVCNKVQFYQSFDQTPEHVCYSQTLDKKSSNNFLLPFCKIQSREYNQS